MTSGRLLAAVLLIGGCQYDPPPTVALRGIKDGGARTYDDALILAFNEQIDADTLEIRIIADDRDAEGEIARPKVLLGWCRVAKDCGGSPFEYDAARRLASVKPDPEFLGEPLAPLLLEVSGKLADTNGNDIHQAVRFEVIYASASTPPDMIDETCETPVTGLLSGKFMFVAPIDNPVSIVQTFYLDLVVDPCTGRFLAVGSDADPTEGREGRSVDEVDLDTLAVDAGQATAYSVFFEGQTVTDGDVTSFQSDAFSYDFIAAPSGTPIATVKIAGGRLTGRVVGDEPVRIEGQWSVGEIEFILTGQEEGAGYLDESTEFSMLEMPDGTWPKDAVEVCSPRPDPCERAVFVCENGDLARAKQAEMCR